MHNTQHATVSQFDGSTDALKVFHFGRILFFLTVFITGP